MPRDVKISKSGNRVTTFYLDLFVGHENSYQILHISSDFR